MQPSTRGTLYPERLPEFHRLGPGPGAEELVRWFWIARWDRPAGEAARQEVIAYPALNLVVEHDLVGLAGPGTRVGTRVLAGTGWAVGALLLPAAVPAFTAEPGRLRDRYQTLQLPDLHAVIAAAMASGGESGRRAAASAFTSWLVDRVGSRGRRPGPPTTWRSSPRTRACTASATWLDASRSPNAACSASPVSTSGSARRR